MFRPVRNNATGTLENAITGNGLYEMVKKYAGIAGVQIEGRCQHALRATSATNALENQSDIAFVRDWLGHCNISTTTLYDKRRSRPKDSPTFKISY